MKVSKYPWGRCSKAIRNECKNPCKKYMAHHIVPWGADWCHCEPIARPPEFKSWAAYNRMLMLRVSVEYGLKRVSGFPNGDYGNWR